MSGFFKSGLIHSGTATSPNQRPARANTCPSGLPKYQGSGEQRLIVLFQNGRQIRRHILITVQELGRIELGKFRNLSLPGHGQSSKSFASVIARWISACWVDLSQPASIAISVSPRWT